MKKLSTPEDVNDLLAAATASAALGAAIETGLLWQLALKPLDGKGVSQTLRIPLRRCHYWLQFLTEMGILEKVPQGFVPSALAHDAILNVYRQEDWKYLASEERERSAGVGNLALYIHEPGSIWKAQGLTQSRDYVEKMRADYGRAREFTRMLYNLHGSLADELAERVDMTGVDSLMDVGGGSGVVSMALLRKYPGVKATVVDIENVCKAGRELASENLLADRLAYQSLDVEGGEFPAGFDMALLCDVDLFGESLFRRLWTAMNDGGRLVIVGYFPPSEDAAPVSRIEWSFLDSLEDPNYSLPTVVQTREQLLCAGFQPQPGEYTLSDSRTIIEAQK